MSPEAFIKNYEAAAVAAARGSRIFPATILAAAAHESGWGKSQLTQKANNFFGIKAGSSWKGDTITMRTAEQRADGSVYYVSAVFRAYPNAEAGFRGYVDLLTNNKRYAKVLTATSPVAQFEALKAAGYATDVRYVSKLTAVLKTIGKFFQSVPAPVAAGGGTVLLLVTGFILLRKRKKS